MSVRRSVAGLLVILIALGAAMVASPGSASTAARQTVAGSPAAMPVKAATWGTPPKNYVVPSGSYFSFPNRTAAEKKVIRDRVLLTIQSVWGGYRDRNRLPLPSNGTIRLATWSFNDWGIARALKAAHDRGVSVQVVAAQQANAEHAPWQWLKRQLGQRYYKAGVTGSSDKVSFARECRGSCRGSGGTHHAKYFLFDNVGSGHARWISMQTSMNLTVMGYNGQWNQAQVWASQQIYNQFLTIFRESRVGVRVAQPYRRYVTDSGLVQSIFFPTPYTGQASDPVMQALNQTTCLGATSGGTSTGRTRVRVINYSIYGDRGNWLAKKLRSLWNAGCDVRVIYSVSTRTTLAILRNTSGRGAIPVKQSVITNKDREIVKYNHSKYLTIAGNWGGSTGAWMTFSGSANWSLSAFGSDEQMQQILDYRTARAHLLNFDKVWAQSSSHPPGYGIKPREEARLSPDQPAWGKGQLKYLNPYGD